MKEISLERISFKARVWLDGWLKIKTQSPTVTTDTPAKDHVALYAAHKAGVSNLYFRDDAGVEHDLDKFGIVAVVSPTAPNRTIELNIGGTIYYLAAKTTND